MQHVSASYRFVCICSTIGKHTLACNRHESEWFLLQESTDQKCLWICLLHSIVISLVSESVIGLPDHLKFFQGHFVFQRDTVGYFTGRPQEGRIGYFPHGNLTKNQKFLGNLKSTSRFRLNWFNSCNNIWFTGMALTLHKSQNWRCVHTRN